MTQEPGYRFFLGGHDLEMAEIGSLLGDAGLGARIEDRHLPWGAPASRYAPALMRALGRGETPVLIELEDDLTDFPGHDRFLFVDHHGEQAGRTCPSSLRQIWHLIGADPRLWTRWRALVEANDIGHIDRLRAVGASSAEIRRIRDADRVSQGVTSETEEESRRALVNAERVGGLLVADIKAQTASAVADFAHAEYDGPGIENLLVFMPGEAAFFGNGSIVKSLSDWPDCWYGGDLPLKGFWGARIDAGARQTIVNAITALTS